MPTLGFDLLIAVVFVAVFVLPTLLHLASDLWQRRGRSFSVIPHKKRHLAFSIVRLGLIYGALMASAELGGGVFVWGILGVVLFVINALGQTDRRLTISAETGLVKWRKISLPWWPSRRNTTFVDRVSKVRLRPSQQTQDLLGVGKLKETWTSSYNGNVSTSGHYSKGMVAWIAQEVNDYLDAFRRHDTEAARASRERFREQVERADAPRQARAAAHAQRAKLAREDKEKRKKAKRAAKSALKEQRRVRRVDDKFRV